MKPSDGAVDPPLQGLLNEPWTASKDGELVKLQQHLILKPWETAQNPMRWIACFTCRAPIKASNVAVYWHGSELLKEPPMASNGRKFGMMQHLDR